MARRVYVDRVTVGRVTLSPQEGHHLRDVLRMEPGGRVELFDDGGSVGEGAIVSVAGDVVIDVERLQPRAEATLSLTIAAAVPKGARADWMVEKLSELGVDRFIPLAAERSVVVPEGRNKLERWRRIAGEAAKQSRRRGVMDVSDVSSVSTVLNGAETGWVCATEMPAVEVMIAADRLRQRAESPDRALDLLICVGPEGGWTPAEIDAFRARGLTAITLGTTILRVETAAVAVAAMVAGIVSPLLSRAVPDSRDS